MRRNYLNVEEELKYVVVWLKPSYPIALFNVYDNLPDYFPKVESKRGVLYTRKMGYGTVRIIGVDMHDKRRTEDSYAKAVIRQLKIFETSWKCEIIQRVPDDAFKYHYKLGKLLKEICHTDEITMKSQKEFITHIDKSLFELYLNESGGEEFLDWFMAGLGYVNKEEENNMSTFRGMRYKVYETTKLNDGTLDQETFRCQTYEEAIEWIENRYYPSSTYTIFDVADNKVLHVAMNVDACKKEESKDEVSNDI